MSARRRGSGAPVAFAAIVLAVVAGCGFGGGEPDAARWTAPVPVGESGPVGEPGPAASAAGAGDGGPASSESAAPESTATPTRKPSRKATTKKAAGKPAKKPTKQAAAPEDQVWDQKPDCARYEGTAVSKRKAKAALTEAASRVYWRTEAPQLRVPARLIKAIAWQESGWQSNIVNCDGGFGLMQAMPDTVAHINQRFGLTYDVHDYRDNARLGANYLAWLTKKLGDLYFHESYDLSARRCDSSTDMCLLNMVIAAYNAGDGGVEQGHQDGELPNPAYVDSVRSLMRTCYCDRY